MFLCSWIPMLSPPPPSAEEAAAEMQAKCCCSSLMLTCMGVCVCTALPVRTCIATPYGIVWMQVCLNNFIKPACRRVNMLFVNFNPNGGQETPWLREWKEKPDLQQWAKQTLIENLMLMRLDGIRGWLKWIVQNQCLSNGKIELNQNLE